ncbi:MAG: response regulator transcription factor [Sphingomonadales bacterium]|nr:response regulator transcription factor [Sphingomonadales bacterium]
MGSAAEALNSPVRDSVSAVLLDHCGLAHSPASVVTPLRSGGMEQPLIVLSALADWRERVASLDAGADDFLIKPIHSEEVAARLRAVIRRAAGMSSDRIVFGDIDLDLKARCAWVGGVCLNLTRNEFLLLRLLLLAPENTITKQQIMQALWVGDAQKTGNAIEVQMARLRRKLGHERIRTLRGIGYRAIPVGGGDDGGMARNACRKGCGPAEPLSSGCQEFDPGI